MRPGALTRLLADLARAPEGAGWDVPLEPGQSVGRFEIQREIGRGGFGVVYEARDTELGRSVAFKAIRASGADAAREARALGEAEAAARLAHPNIVHLYDVGRSERGAFLIMELLRGKTLAGRLREGPLPLREAVRVAVEISRGLAHAHEQGVLHRDLKPSNVFLCDDGQVKVLDFGLAHVFGRAGVAGGTPAYMAPEQACGEPSDERADVYALGVILQELVTGRLPFFDGERALPPERFRAPAALSRLFARMLARDAAERPANGGEVHAQLAAIRRSLEPRPFVWGAWTVTALALVAAVAFAVRSRPLPPGRLLIALADTSNPTGDSDLDAMSAFLGSALEDSRRVAVIARARLLEAIRGRGAPPDRLEETSALRAAHEARARVLIVPTVRAIRGGYQVGARAVDLERDEQIFSLSEDAGGKGGVPDAVDRLAARIRSALREEPRERDEGQVLLKDVLPVNPEAWRHYAEGLRLDSEASTISGFRLAADAYRRAIAIDPEFPLAHFRLAMLNYKAYWVPGIVVDVDAHLEAALRNLHRVPRKERVLVEALTAGRPEETLRHLDRAIADWPADPEAYVRAGEHLRARGDDAAAQPYLKKAIELASVSDHRAIDFLVALGRLDEGLARARRWTGDAPGRLSFLNLARVHTARGEAPEALDSARRALSFDGDPRSQTIALAFVDADALDEFDAVQAARGRPWWEWLEMRGRRREALHALEAEWGPTRAERTQVVTYHLLRLQLLSARERADAGAVWREVEELFRLGYAGIHCTATFVARAGDVEQAQRLLDALAWHDPAAWCVRTAEFLILWKRGHAEDALRRIEAAGGRHILRAQILAELGRHREAVEALRTWRRLEGGTLLYARSLYLEAASLERLGEREDGLRTVDRLLHLWNRADPDIPALREAKALRKRLAAAAGKK